jgi:ATP-dependent RNA circularization protein (DNA/RNA ligase family)
LIQEKRSLKADKEYQIEIQAIVGKLIEEYREAILLDSKNSESEPLPSIISSDQTEEQQVGCTYLLH